MESCDAPIVWLTGTRGFIGRRLASHLRPRARLVALTLDPSSANADDKRVFVDLNDPDSLRRLVDRFGLPSSFIHLGWEGMTTPEAELHVDRNVATGCVLVKRAYEAGVPRFVFVGSIDEYGENRGCLQEHLPAVGRLTRYAQAKREVAHFGLEEARKRGKTFVHVRLTNTYGPGQREGSLLNKLFARRADPGFVDLGHCDNYRDYIHVDEAAAGLVRLARIDGCTIVNLGGGRPILLRDFVLSAWRHMGANPARLNFGALPRRTDEPSQPEAWVDLSRLEEVTGWKPSLSLDQGLQQTIAELEAAERRSLPAT